MEQETEVKTFKVRYMCDDCGKEVTFIGVSYPTSKPKYVHVCTPCNREYVFYCIYPEMRYKEVGE